MTTISFSNETPKTHDAAGYEALTYTEIGGDLTSLPIAEFDPLYHAEIKCRGKVETVCVPYISQASADVLMAMMRDIAIERGDMIE